MLKGQAYFVIVMALLIVFCLFILIKDAKSHYYRRRGKKIEQKAISKIKLPDHFLIEPNKPVPPLGDADIFVTNTETNKSWVIEIKSYEGAKRPSWFSFTNDEIVRPCGNKFSRNAITQVLLLSEKLDAKPILWLPAAPYKRKFKTKSGVLVFQGPQKPLTKYLKKAN